MCVCVCVRARLSTCAHVCLSVSMHACLYVCLCMLVHIFSFKKIQSQSSWPGWHCCWNSWGPRWLRWWRRAGHGRGPTLSSELPWSCPSPRALWCSSPLSANTHTHTLERLNKYRKECSFLWQHFVQHLYKPKKCVFFLLPLTLQPALQLEWMSIAKCFR